jgi:hypothetical protein
VTRVVLLLLGDGTEDHMTTLIGYCAAHHYRAVAVSRTLVDAMKMIDDRRADRVVVVSRSFLPVESTTEAIRPLGPCRPRTARPRLLRSRGAPGWPDGDGPA